jgi:hypothetical protein
MSGYIENWGYGQGDGGGSGNLPTFPDAGATNALAIQTASYVLLIGDIFTITNVVANNTGPTTISINSATPVAIVGLNNTPMQGHELVAGLDAVFFLNSVGTVTLISAMSGSLQIADGVQNHHAVTIGQLITQLGLYLKTSNNLSEIAAEGSAAQLAAQTNLAIPSPSNYLQVSNLLDEILALGPTAQATARTNLAIPSTASFLQTENNLSEIQAEGSTAQSTARSNLGIPSPSTFLQVLNLFSEIAALGSTDQATALANIGAQKTGLALLIANNLSEIAEAGTAAQSAAQTNLGIPAPGNYFQVSNLLSEIAALGTAAQATAQGNLGISGSDGGGSGLFLGTTLITASGTYSIPALCNTIIAEACPGGGGSGYIPAMTSTENGGAQPGAPGGWVIASIPKSQLSTQASNTIVISIGAGGTGGATSGSGGGRGGTTTIDGSVVSVQGGTGGAAGVSTTSSSLQFYPNNPGFTITNTITVTSPSITIATKNNFSSDFFAFNPGLWISNGAANFNAAALGISGLTFFSDGDYGKGAPGQYRTISQAAIAGIAGQSGAVRLWFYS